MNFCKTHHAKKGFTLIELIAVIAIMAVLGGVIMAGISGGGTSQSLGSGVNVLNTMIKNTRTIAMMRGTKARLIINNEPPQGNPPSFDRYLSFVGIVYEDPETPGNWIAANQGQSLPENIYILAKADPTNGLNKSGSVLGGDALATLEAAATDLPAGTMSIDYPSSRSLAGSDAGTQWMYYEFGADGIAQPGTANKKILVAVGNNTGTSIAFNSEYEMAVTMIGLFGGTLVGDYDDIKP